MHDVRGVREPAGVRRVEAHGQSYAVVDDPRHARLWSRLEAGLWEPDFFAALALCLPPGGLHLDVGAWIGPTVLHAAGIASRVVAVEPDPVAMAALVANLALNLERAGRVELVAGAAGVEDGLVDLYAKQLGESLTSRFPVAGARRIACAAVCVERLLDRALGEAAHVVVKVDVEGGEYALVPALAAALARRGIAADLLVSLHGALLAPADRPGPVEAASFARALADLGVVHGWAEGAWHPLPGLADPLAPATVLVRHPGP